ncbi:serpin family protein [Clostridium ljungdahlii]|uniref:Putative protease inhibitor n=1 Tax=Clostridium ljungdahlii (strain ATCC 55383 / DSM 13528 / PETC) TaxID=748727 RepID=D8GTI4_CLOLD|nr:serpin family protein [Clostridium ljungdahlii]ADK14633.1 putative protease inhibitor [Clostridium ljungdahlii DSM 13528]OAA85870.1 Serpin (serine protease inhibitor) [Clostridium ljungdahlii DSM 13528]
MFKLKLVIPVLVSIILVSAGSGYYMQKVKASDAAENIKQWTEQKDVSTEKVWKLTFKQGLLVDWPSLDKAITVTDSTGKIINVRMDEANYGNSILIYPPEDGYKTGETYYLNVSKDLKFCTKTDSSASNLKQPITMKFTINGIKTIDIGKDSLVSVSNNKFAFDLMNQLTSKDKDKNIIISPLSIGTILAETQNGAAGDTKNEILKSIGLSNADDKTINEQYYSLLDYYNNFKSTKLKTVDSIWVDKDTILNKQFADTSRKYYNSEVSTLDFKDNNSVDIINNWVDKSTDGQVKKIIDNINADDAAILINSVNFKGTWLDEFPKDNTKPEEFNLSSGQKIKVDNMEDTRVSSYLKGDNFAAVKIPYYDGLEMDLFLPDKGVDINNFVSSFSKSNMDKWMNDFYDARVTMKIPKFKLEYEEDNMVDILKKLGIVTAFDVNKADFSGISQQKPLFISKITHKTSINVDEKGTAAAAVTALEMTGSSMPPEYKNVDFTIDRPFVFAIRDCNTGVIVFMGKVENPQK